MGYLDPTTDLMDIVTANDGRLDKPLSRLENLKGYTDEKLVGDLIFLLFNPTKELIRVRFIQALTYELSTRECASKYPELLI